MPNFVVNGVDLTQWVYGVGGSVSAALLTVLCALAAKWSRFEPSAYYVRLVGSFSALGEWTYHESVPRMLSRTVGSQPITIVFFNSPCVYLRSVADVKRVSTMDLATWRMTYRERRRFRREVAKFVKRFHLNRQDRSLGL